MMLLSALYISIDTAHLVLSCLGRRYFAFSPDIFIVEVHSLEPPENRSPGLRRSVFGGGGFLPVCGLLCRPPPPSSAGPFLPATPTLICGTQQQKPEETPGFILESRPQFRQIARMPRKPYRPHHGRAKGVSRPAGLVNALERLPWSARILRHAPHIAGC